MKSVPGAELELDAPAGVVRPSAQGPGKRRRPPHTLAAAHATLSAMDAARLGHRIDALGLLSVHLGDSLLRAPRG